MDLSLMMSGVVDLRTVKKIPQKQRDVVYGYIKEMQLILFPNSTNNPYFNVNQLIKDLCLLYLHVFTDRWDINKETVFKYVAKEHGAWYHIFGEEIVERDVINEYKWNIEIKGNYSGRLGIIDVTDDSAISSVKNGVDIHSNRYIICAGNDCDGVTWFGTSYGLGNDMESLFNAEDIVTIAVNFMDNTVKFHGKSYDKSKVEKMKPTTNCIRVVAEFAGYEEFGWSNLAESDLSATMILRE